MTWDVTPEQGMLQESVARFFRDEYGFERRRGRLATPLQPDGMVWQQFAELGWLAAPFPEDDGGLGGGAVEAAIVMEGIGRSLALEPYLTTVILCGGLLAELGSTEQKQRHLQAVIDGSALLALAYAEPQSRYALNDCLCSAGADASGFVLNGRKAVVLGGAAAHTFIVVARTQDNQRDVGGLSLFLVPRETAGLAVLPYSTIDGLNACELQLENVRLDAGALLGPLHAAFDPLEKAIDTATVALCAEAVGAMSALLDLTLDYMKTRRQFGRPLGANQALQHRLVDMHIALEETKAIVAYATQQQAGSDAPARRGAASAAKIQVGRTGRLIGQEAVQMHGGMGVTDESAVSHYFKRLATIDVWFGNAAWHERRFAQQTLDVASPALASSPEASEFKTQVALSREDEAFCDEVRTFIADHLPADIAAKVDQDQILVKDDYLRWQQILGQKGWLAYTWPAELGGPGWSVVQQYLFDAICAEMNCPPIVPFGTRMVGPVIQAFGTDAQKQRFIGPILQSTQWWCQGYSEPMAGSDLAALQTRAEDRGDHYLVNGQKIWTSWAHYADWMFCLVRTSREERPQQGITFLLIDMTTPGIEIHPITSLDGTHSLNAIFFNDVRVPKENRIGEEGSGWSYAKFLLSHERLDNASVGFAKRLLKKLKRVAAQEQSDGAPLSHDPAFRSKLVDVEIRLLALDLRVLRMLAELAAGGKPGPTVSSLKVRGTELCQRILELLMEASGYYALPYQKSLILGGSAEQPVGPAFAATAAARYFNRRAMSIFGGTTEVQKNIMAKAVLGLG